MKILHKIFLIMIFTICVNILYAQKTAPNFVKGNFTDDYGIKYTINDTLWVQLGGVKQSGITLIKYHNVEYHIIKWNEKEQYLIAKNGSGHKTDENKYTRIDFMNFEGMAPWNWGFCLTAYKAASDLEAEQTAAADRKNPKKGCNGYPFSRMKVVE